MNRTEWSLAVRPLSWLRSHADDFQGLLDIRTAPQRRMMVWHPDRLRELFQVDARLQHPGSRSLLPLLGPTALQWIDGPQWRAYRATLGPPLHGRGLTRYRETISQTVHEAIDRLTPGITLHLSAWTRQLTLTIASKIILGCADQAVLEAFTAWLDRALGSRRRMLLDRWLSGGLPRSGTYLDQSLIASAKSSPSGALVSLLRAADSPLAPIEDDELRDQVVSLLFAGHETTAATTAWTLYWLDRHRQARLDVLSDLDATDTDGADPDEVPHLQAIIQEVLRWCPPVEVAGTRALADDMRFAGQVLPAGTVIIPAIYLAHHRADVWPDPFRFDPGRFMGDGRPTGYIPFGGGTRRCLGEQLGLLEARLIVTALLRRRSLRCKNPRAGTPVFRGHAIAPSAALRMDVTSCRTE